MPGVEIKTAVKTLLENAFGPTGNGSLKHVLDQYPRAAELVDKADFPRCIIFDRGHLEEQLAGGNSAYPVGVKSLPWQIVIHMHNQLQEPLTDAPAWDQLLDDVEALLRQNPTLGDLATTDASRVLSSQRLKRETVQPDTGQLENAYNTFITLTVEELITG